MAEIEPGSGPPKERQSIKASRWALSVPFGVVTSSVVGTIFSAVVGSWQPNPGWQQNIIFGLILLAGSLATGVIAGARTLREWGQAAMLTFAGIAAAVVLVVIVFAIGAEPPR